MSRLFDCFLYNNEIELLEIRLQLLSDLVDKFVIVWASEAFTGKKKRQQFPFDNPFVRLHARKIQVVVIDKLQGTNTWQKESYSRNRMVDGLAGLEGNDIVMISDVDEIPRPSVLRHLQFNNWGAAGIKVLGLDYFNFKFNYKLIHGLQAICAGPVLCRFEKLTSPQSIRDYHWRALEMDGLLIEDGGWHFSFLTRSGDLVEKLTSFAHQEPEIQSRKDDITELIRLRQGFHDHLHAASVWAIVNLEHMGCVELESLIRGYPDFIIHETADDDALIQKRVRRAIHKMYSAERGKVLRCCTIAEFKQELLRRIENRFNRISFWRR